MIVIEFVGAPYSGKTYIRNDIEKYLLKKNKNFYTYKKFLLTNYSKFNNKNLLEKFIFLFLNYKYQDDIKKIKVNSKAPKYKNHILRNYLNKKVESLKMKIFKDFKRNNISLVNLITKFLKKNNINVERRNELLRWFVDLSIGHHIYKKANCKNNILIDCEGFTHRLSSFLAEKYDNVFLNKYLRFAPIPDVLIYINEKPSNCKKRIIKANISEDIRKYAKSTKKFSLISKKIFENIKDRCPNTFVINAKSYNASIKKKILKSILIEDQHEKK